MRGTKHSVQTITAINLVKKYGPISPIELAVRLEVSWIEFRNWFGQHAHQFNIESIPTEHGLIVHLQPETFAS